jgi:hypothetical protein
MKEKFHFSSRNPLMKVLDSLRALAHQRFSEFSFASLQRKLRQRLQGGEILKYNVNESLSKHQHRNRKLFH